MIEQTINLLGLRARDKITGYQGTITSVYFDLYGCVQAAITPDAPADATKLDHGHIFDVQRLDVADTRVMPVPDFRQMATQGTPQTYTHGPAEKSPPKV